MANKPKRVEIPAGVDLAAMGDIPEDWKNLTLEEIEKQIKLVTLQSHMLDLDRIQDENQKRISKRHAIEKFNREIQQDMAAQEAKLSWLRTHCRHRMGGYHSDITAGDGKPCIARTQMLDGVTWLLQCLRCRTKIFTPHPSLQQTDPEKFERDMAEYKRFWELSCDSGMSEIRGPTFSFVQNGVPIIPQRV